MARLQILAKGDDVRILTGGREIEDVAGFAIGAHIDGIGPTAVIYVVPDLIEFEGHDIPMRIAMPDDPAEDDLMELALAVDRDEPVNADTAIMTGYSKGRLTLQAVMTQRGVHWIGAETQVPLAQFFRETHIPLADIALALAELTEERR